MRERRSTKVKITHVKLGSAAARAKRRVKRRRPSRQAVTLRDAMRAAVEQTGSLHSLVGQEVIFTKAEFKKRRGRQGPQLVIQATPVLPTLPRGGMVIKPLDKLWVRLNVKEGVAGIYSTHDKANKDLAEGTLVTWARFIE